MGDLDDPNAIGRREGFFNVIENASGLFENPIEVATRVGRRHGAEQPGSSHHANPDVDFIYTSSDFLFPTIRSVLEPRGKWVPAGQPGHVLLGGLDGDATACKLIKKVSWTPPACRTCSSKPS